LYKFKKGEGERERERVAKYKTVEDFLWDRRTCHWVNRLQYFEGT